MKAIMVRFVGFRLLLIALIGSVVCFGYIASVAFGGDTAFDGLAAAAYVPQDDDPNNGEGRSADDSDGSDLSGLSDPEPGLETVPSATLTLRALDKITARITEISVDVGKEVMFGRLLIKPVYCRTRPPIEPPETFAYLEIREQPVGGVGDPKDVFAGWMLASSPALNGLEHPVYDVWVISCNTAEGSSSD